MTTAHNYGRREAVEKCGEQPREPVEKCGGNGRRGRKGEMGAREHGKKRKQHTARCLPLPNSSSSNDRSSKRRNASAAAACI